MRPFVAISAVPMLSFRIAAMNSTPLSLLLPCCSFLLPSRRGSAFAFAFALALALVVARSFLLSFRGVAEESASSLSPLQRQQKKAIVLHLSKIFSQSACNHFPQ
jgi:hypothetical protein